MLRYKSRSTYYKHRVKLEELTKNYSIQMHREISEIMESKIDYLTGKGAQNDPLYIMSTSTPPPIQIKAKRKTVCTITGLNISMQKKVRC